MGPTRISRRPAVALTLIEAPSPGCCALLAFRRIWLPPEFARFGRWRRTVRGTFDQSESMPRKFCRRSGAAKKSNGPLVR